MLHLASVHHLLSLASCRTRLPSCSALTSRSGLALDYLRPLTYCFFSCIQPQTTYARDRCFGHRHSPCRHRHVWSLPGCTGVLRTAHTVCVSPVFLLPSCCSSICLHSCFSAILLLLLTRPSQAVFAWHLLRVSCTALALQAPLAGLGMVFSLPYFPWSNWP